MDLNDLVKESKSPSEPILEEGEVKEVVEKALQEIEAEQKRFYNIPEGSDCLKDIEEVHGWVKAFIKTTITSLDKKTEDQKAKDIGNCMDALKVLDIYKNSRINVELAGHIKFEIAAKTK